MKSKFAFIGMVVFGTILFLMPSVYAGGLPNEPEDVAIEEAREDFMADLEEISVNRKAVIEEIVAMWFMDEPGWEEQFRSTLDFAHDNQLLAILHADSYPQVKAILGDGVETLGDTDKDFVFSPVDPCWCVDTRIGGGGFISAGSIRDYNVYGNLASQGGS
jgi:hypothetical protein